MFVAVLRGQALTLLLVAAVLAAYLYPWLGAPDGPLNPSTTAKLAVALIFLIQGLSLPVRRLLASAAHFRFHVLCQASNFLLAPALMFLLVYVFKDWIPSSLVPGLLFLSAAPTTISSAIIMTSNSSGNVSAALLSTALSNVLGVFLTPLICMALIDTTSRGDFNLIPVISKLFLLVLVPLLLGQAIRPFLRDRIDASQRMFKRLSNGLIIFIVYTAFCESFELQTWNDLSAPDLWSIALAVSIYLVMLSSGVWFATALLGHDRPLRIAAFFCGSQKTLAAGAPMAALIFATSANTSPGLIIIPLMIYHPLQLVLGSLLSPWLASYVQRTRRTASP